MPLPVASLVLLFGTASAVAPSDGTHQGLEPQRRLVRHAGEQDRLAQGAAWQRFLAEAGPNWTAEWDEVTRVPRTAWGDGLPMPADGPAIQAAVGALLADHAELFGFEPGTLAPGRLEHHAPSDTWYVSFDHFPGAGAGGDPADAGVGVYRGGISARVKRGHLVMLAVNTTPGAPLVGAWSIDAGTAIANAVAQGPAPAAEHTTPPAGEGPAAERMLLERPTADGLVLQRVWRVETRTGGPFSTDPVGHWVSFVDAATGALLHVHNDVLFVNGTVEGRHHERSPNGGFVTSPLPLVRVQASSTVYADANGDFTVGSGPFRVGLDGSYLAVDNVSGPNGGVQTSNSAITIDNGDATQAEIDTYVFIHQAREWGLSVESGNGMARASLQAYVNIGDVCNAYYDGNVNFFQAGGFCSNTGQNMDVVHHEWGHGFHAYQIRSGIFDNSLSEGAADSVAFFQSGSPQIGPGFFTNGAPVRDVTDFRVYPQDFSSRGDPHENGLIFAGAMWDLWGLLVDAEGEATGTRSAEDIFAGLLRGGSDIVGSYAEALVADDNDGNAGNGTPHKCQIDAAFGRHGLGPGGGGGGGGVTRATHEPIVFALPGDREKARFELPPADACSSGLVRDGLLHYRVDEGDWKDVAGDTDGDTVVATLPAFDDGDFVEYWLEGTDTRGNRFQSPPSGRVGAYTFYVGETVEVYCDNFSQGPGGFRAKADAGQDDWGYGVPAGEGGDPSSGATGQKVWGTNLQGDGLYSPNTVSRLKSPILSTGHFEGVFLEYQRWLSVEDRAFDQAAIKVSGPGREPQVVWSNSGTSEQDGTLADDRWMSHAVDLRGKADRAAEVTIDFAIDTDEGAEFGGWTIDDFCLLAPATPDNRLGVGDLTAEVASGAVILRWTDPVGEDATEVVVVRRTDRLPTGPTDGVVVGRVTGFDPRDAEELVDVLVQGDLYYAVYGTDGTTWSSFTIEGVNARSLDDVPAAPGAEVVGVPNGTGEAAGCACDQPGGALPTGLGALGAVALVVARRRRA